MGEQIDLERKLKNIPMLTENIMVYLVTTAT
jgi:hypothetical protein